jgi:hypothetical protein
VANHKAEADSPTEPSPTTPECSHTWQQLVQLRVGIFPLCLRPAGQNNGAVCTAVENFRQNYVQAWPWRIFPSCARVTPFRATTDTDVSFSDAHDSLAPQLTDIRIVILTCRSFPQIKQRRQELSAIQLQLLGQLGPTCTAFPVTLRHNTRTQMCAWL